MINDKTYLGIILGRQPTESELYQFIERVAIMVDDGDAIEYMARSESAKEIKRYNKMFSETKAKEVDNGESKEYQTWILYQ